MTPGRQLRGEGNFSKENANFVLEESAPDWKSTKESSQKLKLVLAKSINKRIIR